MNAHEEFVVVLVAHEKCRPMDIESDYSRMRVVQVKYRAR